MKRKILLASLVSAMTSAYAIDGTVDPRSMGMGGAGVATANGLNAVYQNPAALSGLPKEKFTAEGVFSLRLLDENDLTNKLDTLNSSASAMSNALNAFSNAANKQAAAGAAGTAIGNFSTSLNNISNKSLSGVLSVGGFAAVPRSGVGYAFKYDNRTEFGALVNYAGADQTQINSISTNMTSCGAGNNVACVNAASQTSGGNINGLVSTFDLRGVVLQDFGLSLSRHIEQLGGMEVGITPKYIMVGSFDTSTTVQSGNTKTDVPTTLKKDSAFSVDVAAAKSVKNEKGHDMRVGVIAKNLIPKSLKTSAGNPIEIAPQVTAGVAYGTEWFSGAVDMDVIKNKALITGLTKESQFMRFGAEFDAKGWAQLRVGYRHDLAGNYAGMPSVGLGFNLKVLNIDLSVANAGKKEFVFALQTGTHF